MNASGSINQGLHRDALPDFRNSGVLLRIVCAVTTASVVAACLQADRWSEVWPRLIATSALAQPMLVISMLLLMAANPGLKLLSYRAGLAVIVVMELLLVTLVHRFALDTQAEGDLFRLERFWIIALVSVGALLYYFHLRSRALSPALSEARLQALQARIRPHFLFNSINAVLSLMRKEPRRAETALEDLAELFRVLMTDNRQLSTLEREVELTRQYLQLEHLRLGDRLQVQWHVDKMPADAGVPPMVLQPLVENAVYHGIEPSMTPGTVQINAFKMRDEVHLVLKNPYRKQGSHHAGNKMAVGNIRERLALHFDAEARLDTTVTDTEYQVHIRMPYRKAVA
ncbi:MAG: sensor histidine kinase [Betaproteobacteria bacterium]|nr:sensor histidine kinase [Betaproteobacteria bacterium]